jgi:hypothetical protein
VLNSPSAVLEGEALGQSSSSVTTSQKFKANYDGISRASEVFDDSGIAYVRECPSTRLERTPLQIGSKASIDQRIRLSTRKSRLGMVGNKINYLRASREVMKLARKVKEVKSKVPTSLVGLAGEFLVMHKLSQKGLEFGSRGAQAGYDIRLKNGMKLEVRTSQLKNEGLFTKPIELWGWRLKDVGRELSFDFLICVALDDHRVEDSKCYLFTREEVDGAPKVEVPRFNRLEKKLWIFPSLQTMKYAQRDRPKYVPQWEKKINRNKNRYLLESRLDMLSTIS